MGLKYSIEKGLSFLLQLEKGLSLLLQLLGWASSLLSIVVFIFNGIGSIVILLELVETKANWPSEWNLGVIFNFFFKCIIWRGGIVEFLRFHSSSSKYGGKTGSIRIFASFSEVEIWERLRPGSSKGGDEDNKDKKDGSFFGVKLNEVVVMLQQLMVQQCWSPTNSAVKWCLHVCVVAMSVFFLFMISSWVQALYDSIQRILEILELKR